MSATVITSFSIMFTDRNDFVDFLHCCHSKIVQFIDYETDRENVANSCLRRSPLHKRLLSMSKIIDKYSRDSAGVKDKSLLIRLIEEQLNIVRKVDVLITTLSGLFTLLRYYSDKDNLLKEFTGETTTNYEYKDLENYMDNGPDIIEKFIHDSGEIINQSRKPVDESIVFLYNTLYSFLAEASELPTQFVVSKREELFHKYEQLSTKYYRLITETFPRIDIFILLITGTANLIKLISDTPETAHA